MANQNSPPEKMMFQLTLRRRGISDQGVLRAMEEVPREAFVAESDRPDAYRDSALAIACGQTISQPFVVAYMTEQLKLQKRHRVLEIGTGSGYQAAILSRLATEVLTVERFRTLAESARGRLEKLGAVAPTPEQQSRAYLKNLVASDVDRWTKVITDAKISIAD